MQSDGALPAGAASAAASAVPGAEPHLLVPASVEEDPALADDLEGEILAERIADAVAEASRGDARRWVVHARSTTDYGCKCPPFVFAPFHNGPNPSGYPYLTFAAGVVDAVPHAMVSATYRFTGRFTGRTTDGLAWARARGERLGEGTDEYATRGPEFVVEAWCVEADEGEADEGEADEGEADEGEADALAELGRLGLVCPAGPRRP